MCKRIFKFELQLSSYTQNIKFSRYCPKFHIFTNIVIFQVYLQLFRTTASSLYISWQGHIRNTLFHFCQLPPVKDVCVLAIVKSMHTCSQVFLGMNTCSREVKGTQSPLGVLRYTHMYSQLIMGTQSCSDELKCKCNHFPPLRLNFNIVIYFNHLPQNSTF